jgi:hypothetical protein
MNSQPVEIREPLPDDVTDEQIAQRKAEHEALGAQNCRVEEEGGQKILVCTYPAL